MTYELWDSDIGTMLAHDKSDVKVATVVRSLVKHHGNGQANVLSLSIDDDEGTQSLVLSGADLIAWADERLDRSNGAGGDAGQRSISSTSSQLPR